MDTVDHLLLVSRGAERVYLVDPSGQPGVEGEVNQAEVWIGDAFAW